MWLDWNTSVFVTMLNKRICKQLLEESYKNERELQVHSLFEHSINLIDKNDRLITILDNTKSMMPCSIMLPSLPQISDKEKILLSSGKIFLNEDKEIDLRDFEIYDGSSENLCLEMDWERVGKRFKELSLFLLQNGRHDGMYPFIMNSQLNSLNQIIYEDIIAWQKSYKTQVDFVTQTQNLIGLGVGLTPSFDDMLCGLILSDIFYCQALKMDIHKIIEKYHEVLSNAKSKTNLISYHMLRMAADGLANQAVKKLLNSFYCDDDNFVKMMYEVKDFGHSSGTDILCGIYCSIKDKIEKA